MGSWGKRFQPFVEVSVKPALVVVDEPPTP